MRFRAAGPDDAAACAPLVFASGIREFGYFLGAPEARCIAFLNDAFRSRHGRFSWRRHRVGVADDGTVLAVMAIQDGSRTLLDDVHVVWALLRFFGLGGTLGRLLRGVVLETELPAPKRAQILVAHCATGDAHRGRGIFSALLDDALRAGVLPSDGSRAVVLDVLVSNVRAKALYERLGFVALARSRKPSRWLPAGLESIRMRLERRS
ncbi:GNAT family N-acetyltransferase [Burkholderia sp. Bp8963]|uniref:GNAT family N-acetyltransferase n=1 Tax=Burkholderia sp. Bp8963 TaxID=2184547 RepID=UPI000F59F1F4|nr:GNAT family N-acetyltransferase [Burkholderia sp. Bp8963]RQS67974.1 GNAT family N-acetyltransferase [Burkholderia sp. Bp8963]